jgi:hypothetical protein
LTKSMAFRVFRLLTNGVMHDWSWGQSCESSGSRGVIEYNAKWCGYDPTTHGTHVLKVFESTMPDISSTQV